MAGLIDFSDSNDLGKMLLHPSGLSAMYSGPISQEVFDRMQGDMDNIAAPAQQDLFEVSSDVTRCMEMRMNYFLDMQSQSSEFERFEDMFSFNKPYLSEDPLESFTQNPSKAAYDAFMMFQ